MKDFSGAKKQVPRSARSPIRGTSIKAIVRATGYSRKAVRQVVRGGRGDVFRSRTSSLDPWLAALDAEWATRRRRNATAPDGMPRKCPSARVVARLMTMARDQLSRQDAVLVAAFEAAVPALVSVRNLVDRFHQMIQRKQVSELASCIEQAEGTALASFANGLNADQAAVVAALSEPRSNGQTEGQITKLKLVKRQMYGRAKLDLLRARLVPSAWSELHQI